LLNIKQSLSTVFHPEMDGQTKRVNSILDTHLWSYISFNQKDWANHLPLAEFAYNNAAHLSTGMTPFFANKGFHPPLEIKITATPRQQGIEVCRLLQLHDHACAKMFKTQLAYKKFADQ